MLRAVIMIVTLVPIKALAETTGCTQLLDAIEHTERLLSKYESPISVLRRNEIAEHLDAMAVEGNKIRRNIVRLPNVAIAEQAMTVANLVPHEELLTLYRATETFVMRTASESSGVRVSAEVIRDIALFSGVAAMIVMYRSLHTASCPQE